MTNEQTLVKVFTEVFKSLEDLQRLANEVEETLHEE